MKAKHPQNANIQYPKKQGKISFCAFIEGVFLKYTLFTNPNGIFLKFQSKIGIVHPLAPLLLSVSA